jgi:hypothetical protein
MVLLSIQGQTKVQKQALTLRLQFDAAAANLIGAAMDADSHGRNSLETAERTLESRTHTYSASRLLQRWDMSA